MTYKYTAFRPILIDADTTELLASQKVQANGQMDRQTHNRLDASYYNYE